MTAEVSNDSSIIEGLTRLADIIATHFKIPCGKQTIKHWQRMNPPFPPHKNNRYNKTECFEWVQKYIVPGLHEGGDELVELLARAQKAKAIEQIKKAEKATIIVDLLDKKYVDKNTAKLTTIAVVKTFHNFVRGELESGQPIERKERLASLGASPEIVAAFFEYDLKQSQALMDKIEDHCAKESM